MRGKRISPSMAVGLAALFFSLGGAGLAASRFVVTSADQVSPAARHTLATQGVTQVDAVGSLCGIGRACAYRTVTAICPTGDTVTGGGYEAFPPDPGIRVIADSQAPGASWSVTVMNLGHRTLRVFTTASCAG